MQFRGTKVILRDGLDVTDQVRRDIYSAWLQLQNLHRTNPGPQYKSITSGKGWRISSMDGKDKIEILGYYKKEAPEVSLPRVKVRKKFNYYPTIDAFDSQQSNSNHIGYVLCLGGGFNPPYEFIEIDPVPRAEYNCFDVQETGGYYHWVPDDGELPALYERPERELLLVSNYNLWHINPRAIVDKFTMTSSDQNNLNTFIFIETGVFPITAPRCMDYYHFSDSPNSNNPTYTFFWAGVEVDISQDVEFIDDVYPRYYETPAGVIVLSSIEWQHIPQEGYPILYLSFLSGILNANGYAPYPTVTFSGGYDNYGSSFPGIETSNGSVVYQGTMPAYRMTAKEKTIIEEIVQ